MFTYTFLPGSVLCQRLLGGGTMLARHHALSFLLHEHAQTDQALRLFGYVTKAVHLRGSALKGSFRYGVTQNTPCPGGGLFGHALAGATQSSHFKAIEKCVWLSAAGLSRTNRHAISTWAFPSEISQFLHANMHRVSRVLDFWSIDERYTRLLPRVQSLVWWNPLLDISMRPPNFQLCSTTGAVSHTLNLTNFSMQTANSMRTSPRECKGPMLPKTGTRTKMIRYGSRKRSWKG
jgi:hypothetical protein